MQLSDQFGLLILSMDLKIIWLMKKWRYYEAVQKWNDSKPPPKSVKEVIRSLVPSKGIKRGKNIEGSELFDGEEIEEEEEDGDEDEEEIDASQLLQALTGDIPVELATERETQECNEVTGNSVSLIGITESNQINKDAKFLDKIKFFFDEYETSAQFTTARNQLSL